MIVKCDEINNFLSKISFKFRELIERRIKCGQSRQRNCETQSEKNSNPSFMEDYPSLREQFLLAYPDLHQKLVLNEELKNSISNYDSNVWLKIQTCSEDVQKVYILMEMTKTRHWCDQVIKMLNRSNNANNTEIALALKYYNTSPGHKWYGYEEMITVTKCRKEDVKAPNTSNYAMTRNPRGTAIIFNNVPKEVSKESQRFESVFEQLYFKVDLQYNKTCAEMLAHLETVKEDCNQKDEPDNAVIVMVITHGGDEMVAGSDHTACAGTNEQDETHIKKFIDTFKGLKGDTVKLFFFTCCREKSFDRSDAIDYRKMLFIDEFHTISDTFVFYSCAEGSQTGFDDGYTYYGKILSESIAQYACNRDISEIMNKTVQTLGKWGGNYGEFTPDHNPKGINRKLYFNPGAFIDYDDDDDDWVYEK